MLSIFIDEWRNLRLWEMICTITFFPILLPLTPSILLLRCGSYILGNWNYGLGILAITTSSILFYIATLLHPWYSSMIYQHWAFAYILSPIFLYLYIIGAISLFAGMFAMLSQIIRNIQDILRSTWYKTHLNSTLFIICIGMPFILALLVIFGDVLFILLFIPWLCFALITWWWVLTHKARSHWIIFLGVIGIIITLFLSDKRNTSSNQRSINQNGY